MVPLSEVYQELMGTGAVIFTQAAPLPCGADAAVVAIGDRYGVFLDLTKIHTRAQEKVAVGHELAHIQTGATYALGATAAMRQKAETRAARAEIRRLIPFADLRHAIQAGYREPYQLAEYFEVTEAFLRDAITYYTEAQGMDFNG